MAKRKRKLRKKIRYLIYLLPLLFILIFCLTVNIHFLGKKSVHEDSLKYSDKNCLIFYPNNRDLKERVSRICEGKEKNTILDYSKETYGDYYRISYEDGTEFYLDKDNNELRIKVDNEETKRMISEYLRYSMKRDEIDIAYTLDYLKDTSINSIRLDNRNIEIKGADLKIDFEEYNYDLYIPLKYIGQTLDINLGLTYEEYKKPRYISTDRPMICFTFDDGPDMALESSGKIVDKLYELDSSASFFLLGNRLGSKQIDYVRESVEKGMEYGSHTQSHPYLTKLSIEDARYEIMVPYYDLYNSFGYEMKIFRPPYGSHNRDVDSSVDLTAILWNVDSLDWDFRRKYGANEAVDLIVQKVKDEVDNNDVVLMHDIYMTSADAAVILFEHFISEGYQLVNVSELMECLDIHNPLYFGGR
ncbi:MAG: polysaccharide deacetylase family protein [Erysipelotrichaceae bacterium]|nr:polysaccharide deacetylase family protein [Erysipelotrichaceae bacterium]